MLFSNAIQLPLVVIKISIGAGFAIKVSSLISCIRESRASTLLLQTLDIAAFVRKVLYCLVIK